MISVVLFFNILTLSKAQLLPVLKKFFGTDPATSVLNHAHDELQKVWEESPASQAPNVNPLNFEE